MNLQPHHQRVVEECQQLTTRINALGEFIHGSQTYHDLDVHERADLLIQLDLMTALRTVLSRRIKRFTA